MGCGPPPLECPVAGPLQQSAEGVSTTNASTIVSASRARTDPAISGSTAMGSHGYRGPAWDPPSLAAQRTRARGRGSPGDSRYRHQHDAQHSNGRDHPLRGAGQCGSNHLRQHSHCRSWVMWTSSGSTTWLCCHMWQHSEGQQRERPPTAGEAALVERGDRHRMPLSGTSCSDQLQHATTCRCKVPTRRPRAANGRRPSAA